MTDQDELALAMSMAEMCAAEMRELDIPPMKIAIALAAEMHRQIGMAMPTPETARMFAASLAQR